MVQHRETPKTQTEHMQERLEEWVLLIVGRKFVISCCCTTRRVHPRFPSSSHTCRSWKRSCRHQSMECMLSRQRRSKSSESTISSREELDWSWAASCSQFCMSCCCRQVPLADFVRGVQLYKEWDCSVSGSWNVQTPNHLIHLMGIEAITITFPGSKAKRYLEHCLS